MMTLDQVTALRRAWDDAQAKCDQTTGDYVDAALFEVEAARSRYYAACKEMRGGADIVEARRHRAQGDPQRCVRDTGPAPALP